MTRPKLGSSPTVYRQFKLPKDMADAFAERCGEMDVTQSDQLRSLVDRWLKQTDAPALWVKSTRS
jgi:hypothetical protein